MYLIKPWSGKSHIIMSRPVTLTCSTMNIWYNVDLNAYSESSDFLEFIYSMVFTEPASLIALDYCHSVREIFGGLFASEACSSPSSRHCGP